MGHYQRALVSVGSRRHKDDVTAVVAGLADIGVFGRLVGVEHHLGVEIGNQALGLDRPGVLARSTSRNAWANTE